MEVEEDPSSQYVDYTNATSLEYFVSDLERTLRSWGLTDKGHTTTNPSASKITPSTCTKVLEFGEHGHVPTRHYALTLFTPPNQEHATALLPSDSSVKPTWSSGMEHFTPSMLDIADNSSDFLWQYNTSTSSKLAHRFGSSQSLVQSTHQASETESSTTDTSVRESSYFDEDEPELDRTSSYLRSRQWFGVKQFLLLTKSNKRIYAKAQESLSITDTTTNSPWDDIDIPPRLLDVSIDPNESKLLLSALMIALNNCDCSLPAFVPRFEPSRGSWLGSAVPGSKGSVSMELETDLVPEISSNQMCISGLLSFFKLKLQLQPSIEEKYRSQVLVDDDASVQAGMSVSASFSYKWNAAKAEGKEWKLHVSDNPSHTILQTVYGKTMGDLDVGGHVNPLDGLRLTTLWPNLKEGTYVDNVVHSTLDPNEAPNWVLEALFLPRDSYPFSLPLTRLLSNLVHAYAKSKQLSTGLIVSELAPDTSSYNDTEHSLPSVRGVRVLGGALGSLTSSLLSSWKGVDVDSVQTTLFQVLGGDERDTMDSGVDHGVLVNSLVSRLAARMAQIRGFNSMCLLWVEFLKDLRHRWSQLEPLPFTTSLGLDDDLAPPDTTYCLLQQRLELLNCCILRYQNEKQSRESDVDEFFDTEEEAASDSPQGVQAPSKLYYLQSHTRVNTPHLQPSLPLTEDSASQEARLLSRLGISLSSSPHRRQLSTAALLSDMQAFKAANPESILADFLRFYLPDDWIPWDDDQVASIASSLREDMREVDWFPDRGVLSSRVRTSVEQSDSMWMQMWSMSSPVPAMKQKRLFDPAQEAERVLQDLETMSAPEMFLQMISAALSNGIATLSCALPVALTELSSVECSIEEAKEGSSLAIHRLDKVLRQSQELLPSIGSSDAVRAKAQSEMQVAQEMALDACWSALQAFEKSEFTLAKASSLLDVVGMEDRQVELVDALLSTSGQSGRGTSVAELLVEKELKDKIRSILWSQEDADGLEKREYVLRCICPRPFDVDDTNDESPLVVNRMYAAFREHTVRFALALGESEY